MAAYVDEMKLVFVFLSSKETFSHECNKVKPFICNPPNAPLQILEGMPMTEQVEELLLVLGPFYELVDEKKKINDISDLSTGMSLCQLKAIDHFVCYASDAASYIFNFDCVPLVMRSARLTQFARQLEGKYSKSVNEVTSCLVI